MRLAGLIPLIAVAAPAAAQEIVVVAPGGSVDADEVSEVDGKAITAAPRADLATALAREAPGVSTSEAQGNPWAASITWRGYIAGALQGTEQGMAVYLDGIRFNQPFGDTLALDLLPEAALAGAQLREASPVYGRNALGGALLLTTASRREMLGGEVTAGGDSFGGYGGTVSLGGPQGMLVLDAQRDHGWRDESPSRLLRGFASIGHQGDGWSIDAKLVGADTSLHGNGVAPVELLEADYDSVFTTPDIIDSRYWRAALLPRIELGETGRIEGTLHYQSLRRGALNGDLADFDECESDARFLCLEDADDEATDPLLDPVGNAVAVDPGVDDYAVTNRGEERTRGGGAGLQWLDERETARGERRFALGFAWESYRTGFAAESVLSELEDDRSVEELGTLLSSASGALTPVSVVSKLSDFAVFASAEIPLAKALSVELGARWSDNRVRLMDRIGTALNGNHRFRDLAPSAEIDFRPSEGWTLSAGYAETSRNPTPAELSCAEPTSPCALANFFVADPPLDPVKARSFHAEARRSGEGLDGHLSLWRSDSRDDIRHIASTVRGRAYFVNLGRSRRQGVEAALEWRPGRWRLGADYAFTDARFRSDFIVSSPANPEADDDGTIAVEAGDRLPGIPRHALNLRAGYAGEGWTVAANARLRSGQVLAGDEGNDSAPVPGYAVFDLRGDVAIARGVTLLWEVRNLLDRKYGNFGTFAEIDDIELAEAPGADDPRAYAPGMPRRVSAALRFAF